jgi:hypothetical protein
MVKIEIVPISRGRSIAEGKLEKDDLKKVFNFCRVFDWQNVAEADPLYLFDVRGEVIHWLDKQNKEICSSLYFNEANGRIRIELGDVDGWDGSTAIEKWKEVINAALEGGF